MVGPITVQVEPSPLAADLADFINRAGGNGFVIASFGSYAQTVIAKEKIDILAAAFGKLKWKVIWKLKGNGDFLFNFFGLLFLSLKRGW